MAVPLNDGASFGYSHVWAITPDHQYGDGSRIIAPTNTQPVVWSGAATPWTSLVDPAQIGQVFGAGGGQQVGASSTAGGACLWTGTPQSIVSLHAFNSWSDAAVATDGQTQGGYYIPTAGAERRAVMWHGSAASAVDLTPFGAIAAGVSAVAGNVQAGGANYPDPIYGQVSRAIVWSGSAQSAVSLHPGAQFNGSGIAAMVAGQEVGSTTRPGQNNHAALWTDTAASYVDLNPPGSALSLLLGTCGSAQVGYANVPGLGNIAGIWFGTATSFEPLPRPTGYYQSIATCVAEANGVFYVGGYASRSGGGEEAFMWVSVPAPGAPVVLIGSIAGVVRRRRAVREPA